MLHFSFRDYLPGFQPFVNRSPDICVLGMGAGHLGHNFSKQWKLTLHSCFFSGPIGYHQKGKDLSQKQIIT